MALTLTHDGHLAPPKHLTAADVMTTNPRSIRHTATFRNSNDFLSGYGVHAAPVIDDAGRPIGVVSRTDFLRHWGNDRDRLAASATGECTLNSTNAGLYHTVAEPTALQVMTPLVHCVPTDAPIERIIEKFVKLQVRCLFVTDEHAVLVGAISVFDLLRSIAQPSAIRVPSPQRTRRKRRCSPVD